MFRFVFGLAIFCRAEAFLYRFPMNSRQHDQNVFDLSFVLYVKKLLEYSRWFHFFVYLYNNFKKRLEIEVSRRAVFCRERGSVREFIVLTNEINGEVLVRLNMRAVEYGPIKRSLLPASKTDTVLERMSEAAFRDIIIKVIIYFMYFFGGVAPESLRGGIRGGRITDAATSCE